MNDQPKQVLSILVEDRFGELARIVGLFSGRGFNIDSLAVNTTLEPGFSRVVLTTRGDDKVIEQVLKQLNKLVRVRKVTHLVGDRHYERELCLATIRAAGPKAREELERVVRLSGARVVSHHPTSFTIELTGTSDQVTEFLDLCRPLGIQEMVRSAPIALPKPTSDAESDKAADSAA